MHDLFSKKAIEPMLLGHEVEPYDDEDSIFELKFDGIRAIAYIEKGIVILRNKRNKDVTGLYPELKDIGKSTKEKVILDGEIIVLKDGKPDFFSIQKRSLLVDPFKIKLASQSQPVHYVVFDILYLNGKDLTHLPLIERKEILKKTIRSNASISVSTFIKTRGKDFFKLVKEEQLEGIIGKKIQSLYYFGKRTKDWKKIKVMIDEDLLICGYQLDEEGKLKDLILAEFDAKQQLVYRGKVFLGVSKEEKKIILEFSQTHQTLTPHFPSFSSTIWLKPELIGTVHYMQQTKSKAMRQPVWKGLRLDKTKDDYYS